jgi:hypothetical protein
VALERRVDVGVASHGTAYRETLVEEGFVRIFDFSGVYFVAIDWGHDELDAGLFSSVENETEMME